MSMYDKAISFVTLSKVFFAYLTTNHHATIDELAYHQDTLFANKIVGGKNVNLQQSNLLSDTIKSIFLLIIVL